MTLQIWMYISVGLVAALAGFWLGRSRTWLLEEGVSDTEEYNFEENNGVTMSMQGREKAVISPRHKKVGSPGNHGKSIYSPATGVVTECCKEECKGAMILPTQGLLYAPASGKITKVYPLGNAFLLRTDLGTEVYMKVGNGEDELLGSFYRPRVVTNEFVNKGKLLLEFDREGLLAEGVEPGIYLGVTPDNGIKEVAVIGAEKVKVGEPLLWVRDTNLI